MWTLIRAIAIFVLSARLTTLIGTDIIHEIIIILLTTFIALHLLSTYYYDPEMLPDTLKMIFLSCLLTIALVGIEHNISATDIGILIVTILLSWCLLDAWYGRWYGELFIINLLALWLGYRI
ncbi:hypothetical protein TI05_16430 [Achromatium sp. WMS3]|nr:hypothetical protein TI05_16430 [Achromatium sp. WMS3]